MSYETRIIHTSDSGDGISVEAEVNGEVVAHTFPKGMGFFTQKVDGKPRFVNKLEEKYDEKMKRQQRLGTQDVTTEEAKIHSRHFENKEYTSNEPERFKPAKNVDDTMKVELDEPEEIRQYLKENMAEGYLSKDEGLNIDRFVDRYAELMRAEQNFQEIIEQVQKGRVQ